MKKVNFSKKLQLNKETIAKLNNKELNNVNGGATFSLWNCNKTNNSDCCTPDTTDSCTKPQCSLPGVASCHTEC